MDSRKIVTFRALLLGLRIDTKGLDLGKTIALSPLTVAVGVGGTAFIFRMGVVVFADVPVADEGPLLDLIRPRTVEPLATSEIEHFSSAVTAGAGDEDRLNPAGSLFLQDRATERLQIVADVLAKSSVLSHHEMRLAAVFDRIDQLAMEIKRKGRGVRHARELVREIGDSLLTQHRMVGRVAVEDKPEILWDHPKLERLYARLADEFELVERGQAVDRKLTLVGDTIRTLLELMQDQRTVRLEWYIIALIAIEIVLSLYELFFRVH